MTGIPQSTDDVTQLRREVRELREELRLFRSARVSVSLDRVSPSNGTPVNAQVGEQLTETVQEHIVVGRDNLADEALDDRVLTGSTIQTSRVPEEGVKLMNEEGLTAYGRALIKYPDGTSRDHKVRSRMSNRPSRWSAQDSEEWPGVWFESELADGSTPPLRWPAGLTVDGQQPRGLIGVSGADNWLEKYSTFALGPDGWFVDAFPQGYASEVHRPQSNLGISGTSFRMGSYDAGGAMQSGVTHNGDGILRLNGVKGVLVNGQPIGGGSALTRWQPPLSAGWTHWTAASWNGLWIEQQGKLTIISGAAGKASWAAGETIGNFPTQFRPANKAAGTNCEMQPNGDFRIGAAGSGASAMTITYFAA